MEKYKRGEAIIFKRGKTKFAYIGRYVAYNPQYGKCCHEISFPYCDDSGKIRIGSFLVKDKEITPLESPKYRG